jgi:thymidylate synthase (FAD)
MTVSLVSITPKAEQLIAYCARVSNPQNQDNPDSVKLIRYLIKHKHWSPFEMAFIVMEINTTRSIAPQILRHRSFSFQEFSQRYSDVTTLATPEGFDLRAQDQTNRQNSLDTLSDEDKCYFSTQIGDVMFKATALYNEMVSSGVAKECARGILPLCTPTRLYMAGSVRSWLHYIDLRQSNGTQKEHRDIALACREILTKELPAISEAMWGEKNTSTIPSINGRQDTLAEAPRSSPDSPSVQQQGS